MQAPLQSKNDADAVQTKTATTARQECSLVDNRPAAVAQGKLAAMINSSPRMSQLRAQSDAMHGSPRMVARRQQMNGLFGETVQAHGDHASPAELSPVRRKEKSNNTGLPHQLKSGIESLSGMSMDHVKVHYNSEKPAQLQAHAYAQGSEIHVGPGQERHLPHEAWHVVQQARGLVRPTRQLKNGAAINDNASLEHEADVMGARSLQFKRLPNRGNPSGKSAHSSHAAIQRRLDVGEEVYDKVVNNKKFYRTLRDKHALRPFDEKQRTTFSKMIWSGVVFAFSDWKLAQSIVIRLNKLPGENALEEAYKYLTTGTSLLRTTIKQPGYATGDQFAIAASMIIDPNIDVVISKGQDGDPTDKAEDIKKFYIESGIVPLRIRIAEAVNLREDGAGAMRDDVKGQYKQHFDKELKGGVLKNHGKDVTFGTTLVAEKWDNTARQKVKTAWSVDETKDRQIKTWLATKHIPAGGDVAVLWSRFSGKKGDIHIEHDTSYQGIRQIITEIKDHYAAIIIAGDSGATPDKKDKFKKIAREGGENVFDLTEFWKEDTPALKAWGGNTRFGQFKLYDYLHRKYKALRHLGMRSGNLEVMAMLGHNVRYMEEPGSEGGKRMEAWHEAVRNPAKTKTPLGYERLLISEVPTRSGKYFTTAKMNTAKPKVRGVEGPSPLEVKLAEKQAAKEKASQTWIGYARDMSFISGNLKNATKPKTIASLNARMTKLSEKLELAKAELAVAEAEFKAAETALATALAGAERRPKWVPAKRKKKADKPAGISSHFKGFARRDLETIKDYMVPRP
jgi:hypothetical protein